jgi:hypothetical protein
MKPHPNFPDPKNSVPRPEELRTTTPRSTDLRNSPPAPSPAGTDDWSKVVRLYERQPATTRRGWFDRSVGFWLGGTLLGVGGGFFGGLMPYDHPVAVTCSLLWWGIYFGCFGAVIGALLGWWAERAPASSPSQGSDEAV